MFKKREVEPSQLERAITQAERWRLESSNQEFRCIELINQNDRLWDLVKFLTKKLTGDNK